MTDDDDDEKMSLSAGSPHLSLSYWSGAAKALYTSSTSSSAAGSANFKEAKMIAPYLSSDSASSLDKLVPSKKKNALTKKNAVADASGVYRRTLRKSRKSKQVQHIMKMNLLTMC